MYPVIPIPDDAPIMFEQLGTKKKFWMDDYKFLFKEVRNGTGEDWAEKIVCEICSLLDIPYAIYDFAVWKGKRGIRSENFVLPKEEKRLILGNELLFKFDPRYPERELRRVRQHTIRKVLTIISGEQIHPPSGFVATNQIKSAAEVFVGYLMLDAWVANQDRHHENWGLILDVAQKTISLAPSFDHASSLAPFERDTVRLERLTTRDMGRKIERYVERASSAFYKSERSTKPLSTMDTFLLAAKYRSLSNAGLSWIKRLENLSMDKVYTIFEKVPSDIMTDISKEFVKRMLEINRSRLLEGAKRTLS